MKFESNGIGCAIVEIDKGVFTLNMGSCVITLGSPKCNLEYLPEGICRVQISAGEQSLWFDTGEEVAARIEGLMLA